MAPKVGWFLFALHLVLTYVHSASLAGGTFPGPLIKAQKVRDSPVILLCTHDKWGVTTGPGFLHQRHQQSQRHHHGTDDYDGEFIGYLLRVCFLKGPLP